jgi:hypothetical protein
VFQVRLGHKQALKSAGGVVSPEARKLLSFTDNRQDASLQAGHFNDFTQVALLRSALHKAAKAKGAAGLSHAELFSSKVRL